MRRYKVLPARADFLLSFYLKEATMPSTSNWILGLVQSANVLTVRVRVMSGREVLPKGTVLHPLAQLPTKKLAERVRRNFGDVRLAALWGTAFRIVTDRHGRAPRISTAPSFDGDGRGR